MNDLTLRIGYVPYLNMVPFHQGFGPGPVIIDDHLIEFHAVSPRELGEAIARQEIDAGAISLVDFFHNEAHYEPLADFGVGADPAAQSVLLFSKLPVKQLGGKSIAVTEQTSTSSKLLQLLLEHHFRQKNILYFPHDFTRAPITTLWGVDAMLLIGDEALSVQAADSDEFPHVTDLGKSWFDWQGTPFAFARWAVKKTLPNEVKRSIQDALERSLLASISNQLQIARHEGKKRSLSAEQVQKYWSGFAYRLTPAHEKSMAKFRSLVMK